MPDSGLIIHGQVRDRAGIPIEDARVWIANGPVAVADVATLTDSSGKFLISVPTIGQYKIVGVADGYEEDQQVINVSGKETSLTEIRLKRPTR